MKTDELDQLVVHTETKDITLSHADEIPGQGKVQGLMILLSIPNISVTMCMMINEHHCWLSLF